MLNLSVVVPTYRRPDDLHRCLQALAQQELLPLEVIVVVRDGDSETWQLLRTLEDAPELHGLILNILTVTVPGVVAAMNLGLAQAQGDIVVFTDDDAAPHFNWLSKIEAHFVGDDKIAGVGGRDIIQHPNPWDLGTREVVGKLQWHGRVIGEHHRGVGTVREVDVLKGVNMSFRRSALEELKLDERMRGSGAQVHFELVLCLTLRRQGKTLIYDPELLVDHYTASRFDEDQRLKFSEIAYTNAVHNETLALLEYLSPIRRLVFVFWSILVGTRQAFGFVQWLRHLPVEKGVSTQKYWSSMKGRWQGFLTWRRHRTLNKDLESYSQVVSS